MEKELTCAFTGHRPSSYRFGYDEEHPDCASIKILMTTQIGALIGNGVHTFLSGMAAGADIWGAELVLRFKKEYPDIRLIAVMPCESQADKWSAELRERYFNILAECDETVYISRHYTNLSDTICVAHQLSIVENPKRHSKSYNKWLGDQAKPGHRELLGQTLIDCKIGGQ